MNPNVVVADIFQVFTVNMVLRFLISRLIYGLSNEESALSIVTSSYKNEKNI
jgi:hypothetical protein